MIRSSIALIVSYLLCSALAAPSFFVPFGTSNGDSVLGGNDDGYTGAIPFTFTYFGVTHSILYVDNNGLVTFNDPVPTYTPSGLISLSAPTIAPFWGDVDTRGGNDVVYRSTTDAALLASLTSFIQTSLGATDFCGATRAFVATWPAVGYYFEHYNKLNTFQVVLVADDNGNSYVILNYGDLQWTTGDASGGSNGEGGVPAFAGFTDGSETAANTVQLPGSGTSSVVNLQSSTNIGLAGQWAFQVNNGVHVFPGRDVHICGVVVPGYCEGIANCPFSSDPTLTVNGAEYTLDSTNVISFSDFLANTGEVGGRLALKGDLSLGDGFSIGSAVNTAGANAPFTHEPYAVVIGANGVWGSGEVFPTGNGYPGQSGAEEDIFAGSSFTGADNLAAKAVGSCGTAGCLDSQFNTIQSYYTAISNFFAAQATNVQSGSLWSGVLLTCNSATDTTYFVNIPDSLLAANTYFNSPVNCNSNAQWVVTVSGTSDVVFHGNPSFGNSATTTLWNIVGSGRTVTVQTQLDGSMLGPNNALFLSAGAVNGQVVFNSISSTDAMDINQIACPSVGSSSINNGCPSK